MILYKVIFGAVPQKQRLDAEDAIESYISVLLHNGQAVGSYFHVIQDGELCAYVHLAGVNALSPKYESNYSPDRLQKLISIFGHKPRWSVEDDEVPKRDVTWTSAPFLYLFTYFNDWESPLCRGDNDKRIPLYKIPGSHEDREAVHFWQRSYRDLDSIWLGCGRLEIPTYRELAEVDSELSQQGRDSCMKIEAATGVPTYYFLMRYWGRQKGEANRLCPGCGRPWRTKIPRSPKKQFCEFTFQCTRCRLVSHLPDSVNEPRNANIGEWKKKKRIGSPRLTREG